MIEGQLKGTSALGDGADDGGEILHLAHGNLRLDQLHTILFRIHAQYPAAAFVHVAHNVAGVAVGNEDLQIADGLQNNRGSLMVPAR